MAAAALIWPALRQRPPGLARQRCAGFPAADGAQAGARLILTGSRLDARLYNLAHSTVLPAALAGSAGGKAGPWYWPRIWQAAPLAARNVQPAAKPARTVSTAPQP
jgi:hypothetical protein